MRVLKSMKVKVRKHNIKTLKLVIHKGKNTIKGATQVNGHSLKLPFLCLKDHKASIIIWIVIFFSKILHQL
jgi:hypothetical protein